MYHMHSMLFQGNAVKQLIMASQPVKNKQNIYDLRLLCGNSGYQRKWLKMITPIVMIILYFSYIVDAAVRMCYGSPEIDADQIGVIEHTTYESYLKMQFIQYLINGL
ncbi:hypothetical protein GQX74_008444 [Glossina fuscipes]|nr:hypothetical protein GQX74_008444 [Glossina fuscipes]